MVRIESEIFNEFVKIAEKNGLVSEADYAEQRIGSDTEEVIQMLYGVRPNGEEDTKIGELSSLIERAHPETVVIAPAHDKMNSVLENVKERQAIMVDIALRTPTGDLTMRRYVRAYDDLMHSLVRVGFAMDNAGEAELTKLADDCASNLEKKAVFFTATVIALIVGATALLGTIAIINNTNDIAQNVKNNAERVILELDDLRDDNPQLVEAMTKNLQALESAADIFSTAATDIAAKTSNVSGAQDVLEAAKKLHQPATPDNQSADDNGLSADMNVVEKYSNLLSKWRAAIPQYEQALNAISGEYHYDWFAKLKWAWNKLVPDDVKDVKLALGGLETSINNATKLIEAAKSQAQNQRGELMQAAQSLDVDKQEKPTPEKPTPEKPEPSWYNSLTNMVQGD